jgi:hypothetical protein
MELQSYTLDKREVDWYTKEVKARIKQLGLFDWETVVLLHKDKDTGNLASCSADTSARLAILALSKEWKGIKPTKSQVKLAATHEVLELLLWELCEVLRDPRKTDEEIHSARHGVIRRLERVLMKEK